MRQGTPHIGALKRTLAMLEAVIADNGASNATALARALAMPPATAHRQIATLVAEGYLAPVGKGRHLAGPRLLNLLHRLDEKQVIANVAAPVLHILAARVRGIAQLGTFENDMVTYRIKTGRGATDLFTKIGMQLEAYCSGIGKVLLAHLPPTERERYLAGGPFVALTHRTITAPALLREELDRVRREGFALDQGEIVEKLHCLAVAIRTPDGAVPAAISLSLADTAKLDRDDLLRLLQDAARKIENAAFPAS
ncbi:IclR family transcriptional regulator [Novosphingobium sp.]|uniref:IclR family transcriptional regulator n=1 Tax=Novosphingobium sp. TaxID=1874826 RepID=UPI003B517360